MWVTGVCVCLALLGGCGPSPVEVPRFRVTAAGHDTCAKLLAALPGHVSDQKQRSVTDSTYAAAWGDPPIVLRCGVEKPNGFDRFAACQTADGVDWYVPQSQIEDQTSDVVMTTVYRTPYVEVAVPFAYRPPTAVEIDLVKAIKAHTRVTGHCR